MKTQTERPHNYGDLRYVRKFAWLPRRVYRRADGTSWRIWWEYYAVEEKFYESVGWSHQMDLYEQPNK